MRLEVGSRAPGSGQFDARRPWSGLLAVYRQAGHMPRSLCGAGLGVNNVNGPGSGVTCGIAVNFDAVHLGIPRSPDGTDPPACRHDPPGCYRHMAHALGGSVCLHRGPTRLRHKSLLAQRNECRGFPAIQFPADDLCSLARLR